MKNPCVAQCKATYRLEEMKPKNVRFMIYDVIVRCKKDTWRFIQKKGNCIPVEVERIVRHVELLDLSF